jgi:hypothetical protein
MGPWWLMRKTGSDRRLSTFRGEYLLSLAVSFFPEEPKYHNPISRPT